METTEIIITYKKDSFNQFSQISFISNGIIETVEPFELKYHAQYLNLDITVFKEAEK